MWQHDFWMKPKNLQFDMKATIPDTPGTCFSPCNFVIFLLCKTYSKDCPSLTCILSINSQFHQFKQAKFANGVSILSSSQFFASAASKLDTQYKHFQKLLKYNHLATCISIHETRCIFLPYICLSFFTKCFFSLPLVCQSFLFVALFWVISIPLLDFRHAKPIFTLITMSWQKEKFKVLFSSLICFYYIAKLKTWRSHHQNFTDLPFKSNLKDWITTSNSTG